MSIWTSRPLAAAFAPLLLAGCLDGLGQGREAVEVVRVLDGSVAIGGPAGYCVDPVGTRDDADGAFVLLGSCAALSGEEAARHPGRLAVLKASVTARAGGPGVAEIAEGMAAYFGSEAGRAMLSRSGRAASVTLHDVETHEGALILRISDSSAFAGAEINEEYLRAVFDEGDSIVMLSVIPLAAYPMEARAVRALLDSFRARVRRENT